MTDYNGEESRQYPHPECPLHTEVLNNISKKVDMMHEVLLGNGDMKKSLCFKVEKNTMHRTFMSKGGWFLLTLLATLTYAVASKVFDL